MRQVTVLLLITLIAGCSKEAVTATSLELRTTLLPSGSSCPVVSGRIEQTGIAPLFSGTISGDIEGTVTTRLDPSQNRIAGVVGFSVAEQTWSITGGTVQELIGRTVRLSLENTLVFVEPTEARNNTRARVVDGANSGNLTYHGTLYLVPSPHSAVEYRGVICP